MEANCSFCECVQDGIFPQAMIAGNAYLPGRAGFKFSSQVLFSLSDYFYESKEICICSLQGRERKA